MTTKWRKHHLYSTVLTPHDEFHENINTTLLEPLMGKQHLLSPSLTPPPPSSTAHFFQPTNILVHFPWKTLPSWPQIPLLLLEGSPLPLQPSSTTGLSTALSPIPLTSFSSDPLQPSPVLTVLLQLFLLRSSRTSPLLYSISWLSSYQTYQQYCTQLMTISGYTFFTWL